MFIKILSPLLPCLTWLRQKYPLLLLAGLFITAELLTIQSILAPIFPYDYSRPATFVVLGLTFLLDLYVIMSAVFSLTQPHAWRNTAKIWMQYIILHTFLHFIDLHYHITAYAVMVERISVEIANSAIPFIAAVRGLYKIYTGQTFTRRQVVYYMIAFTLAANLGTLVWAIQTAFFPN